MKPDDVVGPRVFDIEGTRHYLGDISDKTVRKLVARGVLCPVRLPSVRHVGKPGRRLLFDRNDLDAVIDGWKSQSSAAPNAGLSAAAIKGWKQTPVRKRKGTAA